MKALKSANRSWRGVAPGGSGTKKPTRRKPLKGWKGNTAHPKAPAGGGGPGGFATPGVEREADEIRGRRVLDASAVALATASSGSKPPPATVPSTSDVVVRKSKTEDIDVKVEVLADSTTNDASLGGAKTSFEASGINWVAPTYMYRSKGGKNVITEITGVFELKGTITIQTTYGPGAKSTDLSLYGRGTTKKDKARGNTSLGFHEYCHQQDYLRFLKNHALPSFTGRVGQSEAAFRKAIDLLDKAFKKYWKEMDGYSERRTDEVGYKRSKCVKDGKC